MTKQTSHLCLALALTALSAVCRGTPLAAPEISAESPTRNELQDALASAPETFRVDVQQFDGSESALGVRDEVRGEGEDKGEGDEKQLSPSTQSFLSTLGTALGPIVGAIVGPLLTNIGQNLSAGSGAQAIAQLQQAAAAVAAQQQGGAAPASGPPPSPAPAEVSVTPPPPRPSRPSSGRPTARPVRPNSAAPGAVPARPTPITTTTTTTTTLPPPPKQSFDAFVLDVPGKGPFLFLMTPNVTAAEQTAAIQQAQQQAAQLLAVNGQSSPIGAVASLIGSTTPAPRPQVTKPTSVGPLPVPVRPFGTTPSPLPSYHSLLADDDEQEQQQGGEEVAVADSESERDHDDVKHDFRGESTTKDGDSDYSSQSFLERLFPEMI